MMSSISKSSVISLVVLIANPAAALCPFGFGSGAKLPAAHPPVLRNINAPPMLPPTEPPAGYTEAMHKLDIDAVQSDLLALMQDSKPQWPADYGNYGPFFVRLAWHCSGTYRATDGRGGCSGGRQRFKPESDWQDNQNLDKARLLLAPIKEKYGLGLSWGDLFVMAGTTAIQAMGGPTLGVCVGRVDDEDGSRSEALMPTNAELKKLTDGKLPRPFGTTTNGDIYVNPQGPMGQPIPHLSAVQVRETFDRMGMNDEEAVALIGGGHSFGKSHGACPNGPGKCGTGKGADAYTSGIEGPWTTNPTAWDNSYFHNLLNYDWKVHKGPGGAYQWRVVNGTTPHAPGAHGGTQNIMMLTTDVALMHDPAAKYQQIVSDFARNPGKFDMAFAKAWHKLTTQNVGAEKQPRCATKRWVSSTSSVSICPASAAGYSYGFLRGDATGTTSSAPRALVARLRTP